MYLETDLWWSRVTYETCMQTYITCACISEWGIVCVCVCVCVWRIMGEYATYLLKSDPSSLD